MKGLSYSLLTLFMLTICSCNGSGQPKVSDESMSDRNIQEISNSSQNNGTIKYGSGDVVTKGYLDSSGNMWFATTRDGVFKYNGKSFVNYTDEDGLCAKEVWSVLEDKKGVMWFGTANGLCSFDGKNFSNTPLPEDDAKSEWLEKGYPIINPKSVTSMIQAENGDFWIGSNGGGAYHYDGKVFTSFLKNKGKLMPDSLHHNVILSIIEDKDRNIWFSSFSHGGVSKYDGNNFTHYGTKDGLGDDMINASYIDRSGTLWFSTRAGGMSRLDGATFTTIHETEGTCQNNMASILEDKTGKFWVASFARSGVCWYDGDSFSSTEIENSEKLNDIKFISEDKDGNIWFGGRYGILWRYDGEVLTDFTQQKRL